MEEYLDLVDKQNNVIGKKLRSEVHNEGLRNFRGVSAFLKNSSGQLLIMRRAANKDVLPLHLDASFSGHVSSGETYEQTFARELAEELRLDLDKLNWRTLGDLTPHQHDCYGFMRVYEIVNDDTPPYNPEDFAEHFWLTPKELQSWIDRGEPTLSSLPVYLREFYAT